MTTSNKNSTKTRTALLALALAAVLGGIAAAPAMAQDYDGRYQHRYDERYEHRYDGRYQHPDWRHHARYEHDRFEHRPVQVERGYDYAPPSFNFVFPLNLR